MKANSTLITWLLEESGSTKYSVSKATGIHQTTLANLENGTSLIENLSFKNAAALTEYAELKIKEEEMKNLQILYYHDTTTGIYHKLYELSTDNPMDIDQLMDFSGLTVESISDQLGFDIDFENLTCEKTE